MEAEHLARTRLGIAAIGKTGDDAGAFIQERQWLFVLNPLELGCCIAFSLSFMGSEPLPFFFALGLDHPHRFFVHEQHVVSGANISMIFAHRLTQSGIQVDLLSGLNYPPRLL